MSNPQVPLSGSIGSSGTFPTLGSTAIALADANHTLAEPGETCYQSIIISGSQTVARDIVGPLVAGFTYLVTNKTTGGFAINFGGATGTSVNIPPGQTRWVETDGTNYFVPTGMPLTRTIFVDGGSTVSPATGGIDAPFTTISAALASITKPTSAADANSVFLVWIASCVGGYTSEPGGTITIPAYRNIWLQAIPLGAGADENTGPSTTASVVWANTAAAGGSHPPTAAQLTIYGLQQLEGNVTITDDNTVNASLLLDGGADVNNIIASGASKLTSVELDHEASATEIDAPTALAGLTNEAEVFGNVTCDSLVVSLGGDISLGTVTVTNTAELGVGGNLDAVTMTAASLTCGVGALIHDSGITLVGALAATQAQIDGGALHAASASLEGCVFASDFQLTAATVAADEASWQNYLGQGGLPNGATVTIQGQIGGSAFPANPYLYQKFFNTTEDALYTWNGSAWVEAGGGGGGSDVVGGDLTGTTALAEVTGIQNQTLPTLKTGALMYNASAAWAYVPVYDPDYPSVHGLIEWVGSPENFSASVTPTSETVSIARIIALTGGSITNFVAWVTAEGSGLTGPTTTSISATANNGSGGVRLTVGSSAAFATNNICTVSGTTFTNGAFPITVVDSTHVDLQGSTFGSADSAGTLTRSACVAAIYDSGGNFISCTGDLSTALTATGELVAPFATKPVLVADDVYYLVLLYEGASLEVAGAPAPIGLANIGMTGASLRWASNGTGATKLPFSVTPSSNASTNAIPFWAALS